MIVADAIVVLVTWYTTYSTAALSRFSSISVPSLAQLILVNGMCPIHVHFTVFSYTRPIGSIYFVLVIKYFQQFADYGV